MKIIQLIAYKIATIYWKIFRPQTLGVKLLLINDGKVLLVEHSYAKGYHLPGGGVKSGEMFDRALKREILEELGLDIDNFQLFGVYQNTKQGKIDTIVTYLSTNHVDLNKARLGSEINHADFYRLDRLPTNISPGSWKRVQEYLSKNFPITKKW
jgi:ADP-ribose pyrophosphatase YjhB (NUDIX family)